MNTLALAVLSQIISALLWQAGYLLYSRIALGIAVWFIMIFLFIRIVEGLDFEARVERWLYRRKKRRFKNGRPLAPYREEMEQDPRD